MPPVANTRIPAAWHAIIVAATVVAPHAPPAIAAARFRRETLSTLPRWAVASVSSSSPDRPTSSRPSLRATVAGHGARRPDRGLGRRRDLDVLGYGSPWLISVDSRATTGRAVAERVGDLRRDGEQLGADHGPRVRQGTGVATSRDGTGRMPERGVV